MSNAITDSPSPYADEAEHVRASGLGSPLPVPYGRKEAPPKGYTGHDGLVPSGADVQAWIEDRGSWNICIRLAPTVLGIDVDAYAGKVGAQTLADLEARLGPLPPTWKVTSRNDGISGVRLFRIPEGRKWPSVAGPGIEIIRHGHRYLMWRGSLHPSTETEYQVIHTATGEVAEDFTPGAVSLPALPEAWVNHLGVEAPKQTIDIVYTGPRFEEYSPEQQDRIQAHIQERVEGLLEALREAKRWPAGKTDGLGRGWEKLTADVAQTLRTLLAEGWSGLDEQSLRAAFLDAAPTDKTWTRADADRKWHNQSKPAVNGGKIDFPILDGMVKGLPDFFERRESLQAVHDWARARRTSPWAVLGNVLARVVAATPPNVVLPPTIGSVASLNLFVASVGKSGQGKGASMGCAREAVEVGDLTEHNAGSGEGLVKAFAGKDKQGLLVWKHHSILFDIPEIDSLAAVASRQGATLMSELRKAWSGESLGFAYADPTKEVRLPHHSYRFCLIAGVQPDRSGALLNDAAGGTPQRFIWLPAFDPEIPDDAPPVPPVWTKADAEIQRWGSYDPDTSQRVVIPIPTVAEETILAAHLRRQRGHATAGDDGHDLLCRTKVMVALALLDGRRVPTEEDWELSGLVMEKSAQMRDFCKAAMSSVRERSAMAKGRETGLAQVAQEEAVDQKRVQGIKRNVLRHCSAEWQLASKVKKAAIVSTHRHYFEEALGGLLAEGKVEVDDTSKARKIRAR